ncbi:hypothetical protein EKE94_16015 [Mesobaculum littorinae]|uniref:Uncharacterized protein n=1 Tax=Mesobaculum littorinae TaxID=2486419 RepID=A0A438ADT7_9RHOB|nr:hypothetical protein [Mesobaculum littorinae]RVV96851.1 hypothetical protein EKE94_16015 [Mesobaculum littorinae]
MTATDNLAYLLDAGDVASVRPDWPELMNLAICLDAGGGCELVVFHHDETPRILEKIAAVFGRAPGSFAVSPEVEGYPTRRILFSEERKLFGLVAEADRLTEAALDYAINYRFAREEGLDPDALTGLDPDRARRLIDEFAIHGPKVHEPDAAPRADLGWGPAGVPVGYYRADPGMQPECDFLTGRLFAQGGRIRLVLEDDDSAATDLPLLVQEVAFRDDFTRFVIPRGSFGPDWQPGDPATLDMPAELFPEQLAGRFRRRVHAGHLTVTAGGIFVTPGRTLEAAPATAATTTEPPRKRRKIIAPF